MCILELEYFLYLEKNWNSFHFFIILNLINEQYLKILHLLFLPFILESQLKHGSF